MILLYFYGFSTHSPLVDPPLNTVLYCSQFISLRRYGGANCGPRTNRRNPQRKGHRIS